MAYTSIIPVHRLDNSVDYVLDEKKASRSQNADSLQAAVDYALNKDKTEQDLFCSAIDFIHSRLFPEVSSAMFSGLVQKPVVNISGRTYRSAPGFAFIRLSALRMFSPGAFQTISVCSMDIFSFPIIRICFSGLSALSGGHPENIVLSSIFQNGFQKPR